MVDPIVPHDAKGWALYILGAWPLCHAENESPREFRERAADYAREVLEFAERLMRWKLDAVREAVDVELGWKTEAVRAERRAIAEALEALSKATCRLTGQGFLDLQLLVLKLKRGER